MISSSYSLKEFIGVMSNKSYHDILLIADKEATEVERHLYRTNSYNDNNTSEGKEYAESLKGLICFLTSTVDPFDKNDLYSGLFKQLVIN